MYCTALLDYSDGFVELYNYIKIVTDNEATQRFREWVVISGPDRVGYTYMALSTNVLFVWPGEGTFLQKTQVLGF